VPDCKTINHEGAYPVNSTRSPSIRKAASKTALAEDLASQGVPVFNGEIYGPKDALARDGWSTIGVASAGAEIAGLRPGMSLNALMGIVYDVIDWDPRNDPDKSGYDALINIFRGHKPTVYLKVETPSGGIHWWIASLGEKTCKTNLPGVDYQGYGTNVFIPPTMRRAKGEDGTCYGKRLPYKVVYWNLDAPLEVCDGLREILSHSDSAGRRRKTTDDIIREMLDAKPGERNISMRDAVWRLAGDGIESDLIVQMVAPALREMGWKSKHGSIENDIRDLLSRYKGGLSPGERQVVEEIGQMKTSEHRALAAFDFWNARPEFRLIRDWARARRISPAMLLAEVLAAMMCRIPPSVQLPPSIGGNGSLSTCLVLYGKSGMGKGSAARMVREIIDMPSNPGLGLTRFQAGSGEGVNKAFGYNHYDKSKHEWELRRTANCAIIDIKDISSYISVKERGGSILESELCKFFSGEELGLGYTEMKKRVLIPAFSYHGIVMAGVQPVLANAILGATDSGFAQRWIWLEARDKTMEYERPEDPNECITWEIPNDIWKLDNDSDEPFLLGVCGEIREILDREHVTAHREDREDGQERFARLKLAALLALLNGRVDVNMKDWDLAGWLASRSAALQAEAKEEIRKSSARSNLERARSEGIRRDESDKVADQRREIRIVNAILRNAEDWIGENNLIKKVSRHRETRDEARDMLPELVESGQLETRPAKQGGTQYRTVP
jgi:hypothetical protein